MKSFFFYLLTVMSLIISAQNGMILERLDTFGGTGIDEIYATVVDSQGNVINTGLFHDTVDFDPGTGTFELTSSGNEDIFIQKLSPDGQLLWAKQLGGNNSDTGLDMLIDNNDNIYITGWFMDTVDFDPGAGVYELTSAGSWDVYVLKLDANGDFVWAKRFGNDNLDFASGMVLDSSGNLYLTGVYKETIDFDPGSGVFNLTSNGGWDIFILKLDANGDFVWAQNLGGPSYDKARDIAIDNDDNLYIAGQFRDTVDFDYSTNVNELTATDNYDAFVLKLDVDGNFIWVKQFSGTNKQDAVSVSVDNQQNVYVAGKFLGDIDVNLSTPEFNVGNNYNAYVVKLDANGNAQWIRVISSQDMNMLFYINVIADKIYAGGYFEGDALVTWDYGFYNLTSAGGRDVIMLVYNTNGDVIDGKNFGSSGAENLYKITGYNEGIYVAGSFEGTVNFDENGTDMTATSNGEKDAYLMKIALNNNAVDTAYQSVNMKIFPNPAKGRFYVELQEKQAVQIEIFDASGKLLMLENYTDIQRIPVELFGAKGLLFVQVSGENFKEVYKLIAR